MNFKKLINVIVPDKVKSYLKAHFLYEDIIKKSKKIINPKFLLLTPEHSNLGDHAIAFSEIDFLGKEKVVEITGRNLYSLLKYPKLLKKAIGKNSIYFNGGGNLGTFWFEDGEMLMRKTCNLFPDNIKIVFPQTIYYSDDDFGKTQLKKSIEIYNSFNNLIFTAREKESYNFMKNIYNRVYLIPDMALRLNECGGNCSRNGAMILFRSDNEKTMDSSTSERIIDFAKSKFSSVCISDMGSGYNIYPKNRSTELSKKFEQFRSREIVFTDRLHGMIFAAVTGTPCVVLNSKRKVKGVYDWIFASCPYIIFTENINEMDDFIKNTIGKKFFYDNSAFVHYYDDLKNIIKEEETKWENQEV
ncbi:MAG: polysaccharide pyruvyl transferase family protein [Clostridiales bacterium]|nr:polysaccharide pyruvyl transferase family protein [Clostridiales bacterium]